MMNIIVPHRFYHIIIIVEVELTPFEGEKSSDTIFDVFICHSGADKEWFVASLALQLEALGVKVFYDQKSIPGGRKNEEAMIKDGLLKSKMIISIVTNNYFNPKKQWPQRETLTAIHNQMDVLPVVIDLPVDIQLNEYGLHVMHEGKVMRLGQAIRSRACLAQDKEFKQTSNVQLLQRIYTDVARIISIPPNESLLIQQMTLHQWKTLIVESKKLQFASPKLLSLPIFNELLHKLKVFVVRIVFFDYDLLSQVVFNI